MVVVQEVRSGHGLLAGCKVLTGSMAFRQAVGLWVYCRTYWKEEQPSGGGSGLLAGA